MKKLIYFLVLPFFSNLVLASNIYQYSCNVKNLQGEQILIEEHYYLVTSCSLSPTEKSCSASLYLKAKNGATNIGTLYSIENTNALSRIYISERNDLDKPVEFIVSNRIGLLNINTGTYLCKLDTYIR